LVKTLKQPRSLLPHARLQRREGAGEVFSPGFRATPGENPSISLADALSHAQLQSFVAGANPHKRSKLTAKIPNRLMEVGTT
jgi:hypothetical protein